MLLSLVVHTYSLRYWLPATVMLGTAPAYLLSWGAWRLLSTVVPARLYHRLDDRLYCIYQSMVLFFFENYTGVEVGGPFLGTLNVHAVLLGLCTVVSPVNVFTEVL